MKKLLIFIMLLTSLISLNSMNEVEALGLFDFELDCTSSRFMFINDGSGNDRSIDCNFLYEDTGLQLHDIDNFTVSVVEVDYNGDLIRLIGEVDTEFEHSTDSKIAISRGDIVTNGDQAFVMDIQTGNDRYDIISYTRVYVEQGGFGGVILELTSLQYQIIGNTLIVSSSVIETGDLVYLDYMSYNTTSYDFDLSLKVKETLFNDLTLDPAIRQLYDIPSTKFYQLRIGDRIIYSGAVSLETLYTPIENTTGYYVNVSNSMHESSSLDLDFTNSVVSYNGEKNYFNLYYKVPTNEFGDFRFRFYDIKTGTIEEEIYLSDIYTYQDQNIKSDSNVFESYISLGVNNQVLALRDTELSMMANTPSNISTFSLDKGVYMVVLIKSDGTMYDYSDNLLIVDDYYYLVRSFYELRIEYDEISLEEKQQISFLKRESYMNDYFTTISAKDVPNNIDYAEYINNSEKGFITQYGLNELLTVDDVIGVNWVVEPITLPLAVDPAVYRITLSDQYKIVDEIPLDNQIFSLGDYYGLGSEEGLQILGLIIMLVVNIILVALFKVQAYIVYVIVDSAMLLLLSSLGILSVWFGIGIGILILISIVYSINATRRDEL